MDVTTRRFTLLAVLIGLVGVAARMAGVLSLELWSDEARWCEHLLTGTGTWFRPAGYMWLTRQILDVAGVSEPALRSLSTVAGIALLPALFFVARRLVASPAAVVTMLWIVAIHPIAIAMSKEFKPYIVEALVHAVLIGLALAAHEQPHRRRWAVLLVATSTLAPFFAWTIVFAYPAVYAVLGLQALREKRWRDLSVLIVGCMTTLAVLVGIFLARLASKKPATEYWGKKYDVFYVGDGPLGYVAWFLRKTADVASFPGRLFMPWSAWVEWLVHAAVVVVVVAGITSLVVRRRVHVVALLLAPWGVMLVFNAVGAWPYGLFRTNTFMLVYTLLLFAIGLEAIALAVKDHARLRPIASVVALLGCVLTLPFEARLFAHKGPGTLTSESSARAALERIFEAEEGQRMSEPLDDDRFLTLVLQADEARKSQTDVIRLDDLRADAGTTRPLLVLDGHACTSMRYYRDFDADSRPALEEWLPGHFVTLCTPYSRRGYLETLNALSGRDFWLVTGKTGWSAITKKTLAPMCTFEVDASIPPSTHVVRCRHKPSTKVTPRAQTGNDGGGAADADDDD